MGPTRSGTWAATSRSEEPWAPPSRVGSLAFSPHSRFLAVGSGSLDGAIRLFEVSDKAPREQATLVGARVDQRGWPFRPTASSSPVQAGSHHPTLGRGGRRGRPAELRGHNGTSVLSPSRPMVKGLASAAEDGTVRLWAVTDPLLGTSEPCSPCWANNCGSLHRWPNPGNGCRDGSIRLWNLAKPPRRHC